MPIPLPTGTLTLQLIFDLTTTSWNAYGQYGRFLPDDSTQPQALRSKVWIWTPNSGKTIITTDNPASPYTIAIGNNPPYADNMIVAPTFQIMITGILPTGYTWQGGGITAIFGRGPHHGVNQMKYASPYGLPAVTPPSPVCAVFHYAFTGAPVLYKITQPWYHSPAPATDIYGFNVGIEANITAPAGSTPSQGWYSFAHDPDLQVDM